MNQYLNALKDFNTALYTLKFIITEIKTHNYENAVSLKMEKMQTALNNHVTTIDLDPNNEEELYISSVLLQGLDCFS